MRSRFPRGFLEIRVEDTVPDHSTPIIAYCAAGTRSLIAGRTLREMGYQNVVSMSGGFTGWKNAGLPFATDRQLSQEQATRYSRHFLLPEVGEKGQAKLLDAKVLCIGAGGLGSPTAFYLAAAGVGTIGIVDHDVVDLSNLQRQILHTNDRIGLPKVESAEVTLRALNPDVRVVKFHERLSSENVRRIFEGFDIIVNGCDNFPTRYLVNDACVFMKKPLVDGSIFQFEGQATVFYPPAGPVLPLPLPRAAASGSSSVVRRSRRARRAARPDRLRAGARGDQADPRRRQAAHRPHDSLRHDVDGRASFEASP